MANVGYSMTTRKQSSNDPRRIGLWKIGREIGSGSSGRVRIARHSKTGQHAAIKIISKILLNSRVSLNRMADETEHTQLAIEREIVVMKLLDHPNLMRLYDVWETSTELYLILEYVQGGELFELLCNNGKLPVLEALNYFQQIIAAVDYCHKFGIAHRDLKPENILLDQDSNIKIADFGMAAWQATNDGMLRTSCGSPHYAAPEIVSGDTYNGSAADIWSCGVILFVLLAGKLPFDDEDCGALLDKVKKGEYEMFPDIHPLAQDLIRQMLCKDAAQRITMTNIMAHPFFSLHPLRVSNHLAPALDGALATDGPSSIDPDIFANLRTLWHGTSDEQIIECLTNSEPTLQKGIYHLLVQYRAIHLQEYQEEEGQIAQDRVKRTKSRKTKALDLALKSTSQFIEMESSPSSLPPRDDPPTPRRASGRRHVSGGYSMDSLFQMQAPTIQLHSPSPEAHPVPSPSEWESLPPLTVPELQDDNMQAFFNGIVQHLNALQAKAVASEHGIWSPNLGFSAGIPSDGGVTGTGILPTLVYGSREIVPPRRRSETIGVHSQTGTRPLSVKRKQQRPHSTTATVYSSNKENMGGDDFLAVIGEGADVAKRSSLKSRKGPRVGLGEKRVHIVEPTTRERSKLVKRWTKGSASPVMSDASSLSPKPFSLPPFSSSSPKHTWLGTVFGFRPARLSLLSLHDLQATRSECRRLLMTMNIRVILDDHEGFGVLKCRLEEVREPSGVMNVLKAVKFRVEFQEPRMFDREDQEAPMVSMFLVFEKGSSETFKEVYRRLEHQWELNETKTSNLNNSIT